MSHENSPYDDEGPKVPLLLAGIVISFCLFLFMSALFLVSVITGGSNYFLLIAIGGTLITIGFGTFSVATRLFPEANHDVWNSTATRSESARSTFSQKRTSSTNLDAG